MSYYNTRGVCSKGISFEIENGIVKQVKFDRGCPGNLMAISKLVEGMPVDEVIKRLKGITCSGKPTSCPDQLARALEERYAGISVPEDTYSTEPLPKSKAR